MASKKKAKKKTTKKKAKKKAVKKSTTKKEEKDKGGRPTSFKTEYLTATYKLCELGATDKDLAAAFNVTRRTICGWKKKYPEVFAHIKSGKDDANEKVKNALYHRALGTSVEETKIATFEGQITDSKKIKKHFPPDVTACEIWLINRDPENWKSRQADRSGGGNDTELADALSKLAEKLPG